MTMRYVLIAILLASAAAPGEEGVDATVESEGVATVETRPDTVTFTLSRHASGDTLTSATDELVSFESDLRQVLAAAELNTSTLQVSGLMIPDVKTPYVSRKATVKMGLPSTGNSKDDLELYADLCARIVEASKQLGCQVLGPTLTSSDRQLVEQEAVRRATENAFYKADSVADLMNSEIYQVSHVAILSTEWTEPSGTDTDPWIARCTARVRVTYNLNAYR